MNKTIKAMFQIILFKETDDSVAEQKGLLT